MSHSASLDLPLSPWRTYTLILLLSTTQFLTQASFAMSLVPTHIIAQTFFPSSASGGGGGGGGSSGGGQTTWFTSSYSLSVGTFILISGSLGDLYGHKRLLLCGWAWFGLWSVAAGLAAFVPSSPVLFDVCRAMQGVGPAMLLPNALAVLGGGVVSEQGKKKEMAFAAFAAMAPVGFVVGGLVAASLAERAWWPWGFWGFGLVCWGLGGASAVLVPRDQTETKGEGCQDNERGFDIFGAVLVVTGLVLVNFAWNQAPIDGWNAWYCPFSLVLGLVCIVLFGLHERRIKNSLLPMDIWNRQSVGIVVGVSLGWASFAIWIFYTFQIIQVLREVSAVMTAVQFIPETISGVIGALVTGHLLGRWKAEWLMVMAMLAFFAGCVLSATAPAHQTYWANTFVTMLVTAWGMDISFPASTLLISNMVPSKHQGIGASLITTVVNYSISIGLGIAGTVESKTNQDGAKLLRGYRSALWTAVGFSGLGLLISLVFACRTCVVQKPSEESFPRNRSSDIDCKHFSV